MSHEPNKGATAGVGATSPATEAEGAAAPVPGSPAEAPVQGLARSLTQVFAAQPGQYWGIDTSYDHVTLEEARRVAAAGVKVAVQCLWTGIERPGNCVNNILSYRDAGLIVVGYLSVSNGRSGLQHVVEGYDTLPHDAKAALRDVAIDVELEGIDYQRHVVPAVNAIVGKGYRPLVYTSYNAWFNYLHNPTVPQGWYLWNAFWDNDPDYDFARFPYGGGGFILIGEQFTGGEDVEGIFADRNLFVDWFWPEPEPVPEPVLGSLRDVAFICHYIAVALAQGMPVALSPLDKLTLADYVEHL